MAQNPQDNCAYINFIENNPISTVHRSGKSILFRGRSDRDWVYVKCHNHQELMDLVSVLTPQDENFALIQPWMLTILAQGRKPRWQFESRKLLLPLATTLPTPRTKPIPLRPAQAKTIFNLWPYAKLTTLEYTLDRITRGQSAAVFVDNSPVAWAITHDDGAIGFLYVREAYRGKGYAMDVTVSIVQQLRSHDKPGFVHIDSNNHKSLALAKKLGFEERGSVIWVGY